MIPELARLGMRIEKTAMRGVDAAAKGGVEYARMRSSGTFSLAFLAAMDHPYARRHGRPRLDPAMINEQSGAFKEHWKTERTGEGARIKNEDPKAQWLTDGTRFMFERPIDADVEEYVRGSARTIVEAHLRSVFR